ncbi:PAS domain S-box protein [Haloarchaeobius sp. TZWSO28]|uniref:PAS domain S-box protein n=1 Tax=Haloarchaeobius sp. TZWSO28 TaxID=3446119 RepID=UPI003EBDDE6E
MSIEGRTDREDGETIDVLLVAVESSTRSLLTESLERGCESAVVQSAATHEAAFDALETDGAGVDCIVTAFSAPDAGDLSFLREFRRRELPTPFIVFSDDGIDQHVADAFASGVTHYVQWNGSESLVLLAKQIERAVEENSQHRLVARQLDALDNVNTGISIVDAGGHYIYVNHYYAEMYGYEPSELLGTAWTVLERDGTDPEYADILSAVPREGEWTGELTQRRKDGSDIRAAHAIWDADSSAMVVVARDLTDADRNELDLFEERERFDLLIETIENYGIVGIDPDGNITSWNTGSERINGFPRDEIIDANISILYTDEDVAAGLPAEHLRRAREDGPVHEEGWRVERNGDRYWVDFTLSAVDDRSGDHRGFVCVLHDRTEQAKRERQLQRRVEQLGQFASVLSHDLRNPLTTASLHLELARGDPEDAGEHIEKADRALCRIETLVDSLLRLAKEGEIVQEFDAVSLTDTAKRAWDVVDAPDASLVVEAELPSVQGDPERLRALFENLFRNSLEHGKPDVTVRFGRVNGGFFVADDGPGIPEKEREKVFEYGYSTDEHGTGFGLSIVESIAVAHGWNVTATESESGGARFEFSSILNEPALESTQDTTQE